MCSLVRPLNFLLRVSGIAMTVFVSSALGANPIFNDIFTADPAALVHDGKVYLYAGHDEAKDNTKFFEMHDWLVWSSDDMVNWESHGPLLHVKDFTWAEGDAWASQAIQRNGKFYWYVTVRHNDTKPGFGIGVAVGDSPLGPFKDALGRALITNDMTTDTPNDWDDQAYLFCGNSKAYYAKLKQNMIELDGPIETINTLPEFTEAIWVHKYRDNYYLSYAMGFPEKIGYAMSKSINGPWQHQGILNEVAGNTPTNHQAIIEFNDRHYFIYHTGQGAQTGDSIGVQ